MATVPDDLPLLPTSASVTQDDETAALRPAVRLAVSCVLGPARTHADIEDCTNETLRRALEGRARLRAGEALRPWVLGIARHVALDLLRSRKRQAVRTAEPSPDDSLRALPSVVERLPDPAPGADELLASAQQRDRVRRAIDSLSDGPRQALVLFHVEGLGYQEIAQRLGVPLGTVATWMARGRRSIAEALQEQARNS